MDWKLELVPLPVSDVDRAKAFYAEQVGFHVDMDHEVGDDFRIVQLTPVGSACSVAFGKGVVATEPGSVQGLHLVVSDIEAARAELTGRGVEVSEVVEYPPPPDIEHPPRVRYVYFSDPDGNGWALQEISRS